MELTESWRRTVPATLQTRYEFAETRNAAAVFQGGQPEEWKDLLQVLDAFRINEERIVRPGGRKHLIAEELDEAFRETGWREVRYDITQTTELRFFPYKPAGETGSSVRSTSNMYGGHKVDNVKGRVALDVEWNPKDGNLDRDLSNFRALYEGGAIDVGLILCRMETGMRELWEGIISYAKTMEYGEPLPKWRERLRKTPTSPLGTSTTANFEKLLPRVKRGDGGGCPILAIGIKVTNLELAPDFEVKMKELARAHEEGLYPQRLAQKMGYIPYGQPIDESATSGGDEEEEIDL